MNLAASLRERPSGLARMATVLRVTGDERRLRIVGALMRTQELCVCELVDALRLPQYEVSRHLAQLKRIGLVVDRRDGLWVHYSIPASVRRDPLLGNFLALLDQGASGPLSKGDLARLEKRLALRDGERCVVGFRA